MNWFIILVIGLVTLCKGVFSDDDDCKELEIGSYPGPTCDEYYVCTGPKGSGVRGKEPVKCATGKKFEKYHRACQAEKEVNCDMCKDEDWMEADNTSKEHFLACVGPKSMLYGQRFKCNSGEYDAETKKCGGSQGENMDLKEDAKPEDSSAKDKVNKHAKELKSKAAKGFSHAASVAGALG